MSALLAAELLKLRTTRGPFLLALGILVLSALTVAGLIGAGGVDDFAPREVAFELADAAEVASLLVVVLGIVVVTNEYRHRTITPTFLVTPRRERVLAAKTLTGGLAGLVAGVAVAGVTLALAIPWLSSRGQSLELGDVAGTFAALVGVFALSAVLGIFIGAIFRTQVGAIVTTFVWFLMLEPILGVVASFLLTDFAGDPLRPYLPGSAFDALVSNNDELLDGRWAILLVLGYLAAFGALALLLTQRRDAE